MQIVRVHIENFRGVRQADIELDGTVVFLGDNNTGKSTVAIGADRLSRTQAVDEHDFFGGDYQARDGEPGKKIVVEVVIADLDDQLCTKFRNNLEFWRPATQDMAADLLAAAAPGTKPAVRIRYDYANRPRAQAQTASPMHEGHGQLEFYPAGPDRLTGDYYTSRTSAGHIEVLRVSPDPEAEGAGQP